MAHIDVRVCTEDFDVGREWAAQRERVGGDAGAMVTFVGVVRDRHENQAVSALTLEHYPGMTERSMEEIAETCVARWPVKDVVIIHRVGTLSATDQIVLVMVAGGHRPEAFAACEFLMDYLKTDAVFWKREEAETSSRWVASSEGDHQRRADWQEGPKKGL